MALDVRVNHGYGTGHVSNSINIGLGGQFASWTGSMIPVGTGIAIVAATQAQVDKTFMRLARVGHESVAGFILIGDYSGEQKKIEQVSVNDVHDLEHAGSNPQT